MCARVKEFLRVAVCLNVCMCICVCVCVLSLFIYHSQRRLSIISELTNFFNSLFTAFRRLLIFFSLFSHFFLFCNKCLNLLNIHNFFSLVLIPLSSTYSPPQSFSFFVLLLIFQSESHSLLFPTFFSVLDTILVENSSMP